MVASKCLSFSETKSSATAVGKESTGGVTTLLGFLSSVEAFASTVAVTASLVAGVASSVRTAEATADAGPNLSFVGTFSYTAFFK